MLQLIQSRGDHPRQDDLADDDEHDGEDQRQREAAAGRPFRHRYARVQLTTFLTSLLQVAARCYIAVFDSRQQQI